MAEEVRIADAKNRATAAAQLIPRRQLTGNLPKKPGLDLLIKVMQVIFYIPPLGDSERGGRILTPIFL